MSDDDNQEDPQLDLNIRKAQLRNLELDIELKIMEKNRMAWQGYSEPLKTAGFAVAIAVALTTVVRNIGVLF